MKSELDLGGMGWAEEGRSKSVRYGKSEAKARRIGKNKIMKETGNSEKPSKGFRSEI